MCVYILAFVICRENYLFSAPYFIVNCGLYPIFPQYLIIGTNFERKKKVTEHKKRVF